MPSKKGVQIHGTDKENKGNQRPPSPLLKDGADPFEVVVSIMDKRARNLTKRKERLTTLKEQTGKDLDKDQLEAISKLPGVLIQVDLLRELQKQFADLSTEYQKHSKKKLKAEEKQKKDAERDIQKLSIQFSLRIQYMLNQLDETAKDHFSAGINGAVKLTEAELTQLDDFYVLLNPQRSGNSRYNQELQLAGQHLLLLKERSKNEVVNTTYDALHNIFDKIDSCGYFDKEEEIPEEEEEEEEEDSDIPVDEFTSLDEVPTDVLGSTYQPEENEVVITEESIPEITQLPTNPLSAVTFGDPPSLHDQTDETHTSVPSPDFSGLQSSNLPPLADFQFMRDSSVVQNSHSPDTHQVISDTQLQTSSFPTSFTTLQGTVESTTVESLHSKRNIDGQFPENGQKLTSQKVDLVGVPVGGSDKPIDSYNQDSRFNNRRPPRGNGYSSYQQRGDYNGGGQGKNYGGGRIGRNGNRGGRGRPNYPYNRQQSRDSRGNRQNMQSYGPTHS